MFIVTEYAALTTIFQEYHQSVERYGSKTDPFVGPDLGSNCYQRFSADDTARQMAFCWRADSEGALMHSYCATRVFVYSGMSAECQLITLPRNVLCMSIRTVIWDNAGKKVHFFFILFLVTTACHDLKVTLRRRTNDMQCTGVL